MANGRFTLGKQLGGTLGLVFPDGVSDTEVVLPESGELATKLELAAKVALADFIGTNQSLNANGYQKLPGGLILQWGLVNTNIGNNGPIAFPITFPNRVFSVLATINTSVDAHSRNVYSATKSSFYLYYASIAGSYPIYWFAIGY